MPAKVLHLYVQISVAIKLEALYPCTLHFGFLMNDPQSHTRVWNPVSELPFSSETHFSATFVTERAARRIFTTHSPPYSLAKPVLFPLSADATYTAFLKILVLLLIIINKRLVFVTLQKRLKTWPRGTNIRRIQREFTFSANFMSHNKLYISTFGMSHVFQNYFK